MFSQFLENFKEDVMNRVSGFFLEITHEELPEALPHQIRIVILESGFEMDGFVPALKYYFGASTVIGDGPSVTVPMLQEILLPIILDLQGAGK